MIQNKQEKMNQKISAFRELFEGKLTDTKNDLDGRIEETDRKLGDF